MMTDYGTPAFWNRQRIQMTFTSTSPTTPGFYAWRASEESQICRALVVMDSDGKLYCTVTGVWGNWRRDPTERGGVWSRLVPSDEIQQTWNESHEQHYWPEKLKWSWEESRAKRVMEGRV